MKNHVPETIIIGHRNPDIDSIASASALAELKKLQGVKNVSAACAGLPGVRVEYLFKRFGVELPEFRKDIYPCIGDIVKENSSRVVRGDSLYNAIKLLEKDHVPRLPVVDEEQNFCGMVSLFALIGNLLQTSGAGAESGLTGRKVYSSLKLITEVLEAEVLSSRDDEKLQDFEVYVAAMNIESFKEHIPAGNPESLAIVVGDRSDIHLMSINLQARLMIITGAREIDDVIIEAAAARGVSVIKTPFDSAAVVRRLKFSVPTEVLMQSDIRTFGVDERICDVRQEVFEQHEDIFPVVDSDKKLIGTFNKSSIGHDTVFQVIMVDHNEFDQGIAGIDEVPVIEVIDHHRLGLPPMDNPIRICCDVVGSTCTLVYEMYKAAHMELSPAVAGILLGGVISDTLLLRSPTSTPRDKEACEALEKICKVSAEELMKEIFAVGSLIVRLTPREVLTGDKKDFTQGKINFAVAQVEEPSFEEFFAHESELMAEAKKLLQESDIDFFGLLVTNVVREDSMLLAVGSPRILSKLPYRKIRDNLYDLPGILSRKKQLLPQLLKICSEVK